MYYAHGYSWLHNYFQTLKCTYNSVIIIIINTFNKKINTIFVGAAIAFSRVRIVIVIVSGPITGFDHHGIGFLKILETNKR